ncbi:hypothetical protein LJ707_07360 [Mucilaginibacter sp. UR6-1]|nr:hypothetical protein [Mucilaginibacter sp. UR6-1]MCC8408741.1 hypothetical protein [Mucilaginibacter sp. UR6-1]
MKLEKIDVKNENFNIPEWHIELVRERIANQEQPEDFDTAMDDIEKKL